jgi:hypothetical protein
MPSRPTIPSKPTIRATSGLARSLRAVATALTPLRAATWAARREDGAAPRRGWETRASA